MANLTNINSTRTPGEFTDMSSDAANASNPFTVENIYSNISGFTDVSQSTFNGSSSTIPSTDWTLAENQSLPFLNETSSLAPVSTETEGDNSTLLTLFKSLVSDLHTTTLVSTDVSNVPYRDFTTSQPLIPFEQVTKPIVHVEEEEEFTSMQKWFIATGSVVLAVIILFCINTCIQYRGVCQKLAKEYHDRNYMANIEKRAHKVYSGYQDEYTSASTHIFLHSMLLRKE